MIMSKLLVIIFAILMCFNFVICASHSVNNKILLSNVTTLLLRSGKFTTSRRNPGNPILQLNCKGRYCSNGPYSVICKNINLGDNKFVWECTGCGVVPGFKMSQCAVRCEGYRYLNDPYILKGSCGVFYTVVRGGFVTKSITTPSTKETVLELPYQSYYNTHNVDDWLATFVLIVIGVLIIMMCNTNSAPFLGYYYPNTLSHIYYSYHPPPVASCGTIRSENHRTLSFQINAY